MREGDFEEAIREYGLAISVTQLRKALGSLVAKRYVRRRVRLEAPMQFNAVYAANVARSNGLALTIAQAPSVSVMYDDERHDPYEPSHSHEVWRYEPCEKLKQLASQRATFAR